MIKASSFFGQNIALFGLGGSGLVTALSLVAGGANLSAWDDNPAQVDKARDQNIPVKDLRDLDWTKVDALVLAPGVPLTHPKPHWCVELANSHGVEIIGDVEIFARERKHIAPDCPFIAITGTNGKSTTTALISHILKMADKNVQMGGNIGRAVLSLDAISPDHVYVVECSSYQIDLAPSLSQEAGASAGILLNLTPDHLDRHGDMENYAAIKARLVKGSDHAIIGVDDEYCRDICDELLNNDHKFTQISGYQTLDHGIYLHNGCLISAGQDGALASLDGIDTLRGNHNGQNAAAAFAACLSVGLSKSEIASGLQSFGGLGHRMQPIARRSDVLFVNDSKATNAEAAAPALKSYKNIYWIVGGLAKDGGIAPLVSLFGNVKKAYLIGEAAPEFASQIGNHAVFEISETLDRAVEHAVKDALYDQSSNIKAMDAQALGDNGHNAPVILFSPACASFDQFRNFEVRGEAFIKAVAGLEDIEMLIET